MKIDWEWSYRSKNMLVGSKIDYELYNNKEIFFQNDFSLVM